MIHIASQFLEACKTKLSGYPESCIKKHDGTKFEPVLVEVMEDVAKSHPFLGLSVERISGQRFPDIVVTLPDGVKFGVEVKTTTGDRWTTTGGSIFESTRVDGIEVIFLFFAKLGGQVDYRYGLHEHFLKSVKITHSPRYDIDMTLQPGETIFDEIGMSYDDVRRLNNPFQPFRSYMIEKHGSGADVWWIGDENSDKESTAAPLTFRSYSELNIDEKRELEAEMCALIPEIFCVGKANRQTKYSRVSTYLAARHRIVNHALRDLFSAGGTISYRHFNNVPRVLERLTDRDFLHLIHLFLENCDPSLLDEYWGNWRGIAQENRFQTWVALVQQSVGITAIKEGSMPDPSDMIDNTL